MFKLEQTFKPEIFEPAMSEKEIYAAIALVDSAYALDSSWLSNVCPDCGGTRISAVVSDSYVEHKCKKCSFIWRTM